MEATQLKPRMRKDGHIWGNKNAIITYTGKPFNVLDPDPALINIRDVAHALSQLVRFTGHISFPYTVAHHSLLMTRLIEEEAGVDMARYALLHDASEAYMNDVAKPLKIALERYNELEERLSKVILKKFGLSDTLPLIIKTYDRILVKNEQFYLFPNVDFPEPDILLAKHLFTKCESLDAKTTKILFLDTFNALFPEFASGS